MNRLDAMQIFARVAELSSFTRAAELLGLPKASVSTAVQQLESELGVRLLHRTTRRVELTQDGRAFYERCLDLLADVDELSTMFQHDQALSGRLRVDMSSGLASLFVVPRLPEFLDAHPQLQLELSSTDRRVDLVREGFDCVLRVGILGDSTLVARPLGALRIVNCASPDYLRRYGTPRTLDDLAGHRLVDYVPTLGARSSGWEYPDGEGGYRTLQMPVALTVNNAEAYEAACLAGLGLVQIPSAGKQALFDDGRLVEVLTDFPAEPMPVTALYAHRRNLSKRVRVFMDWVADILRPHLLDLH
ncbi:LysR family transcriptional regulator [Solimonas marina]|uniref:LysR family transcriptional regulator n=1 Tax=Solimonas marina TaxID=2714601 RepID=A0A969WE81_9GAMM|nr:LysR family transcriptional regulator [Solimonas marina]NKF23746.1 LysR family transcriptional regulator [Solimonas marina]